jgi:hypothetical protein
MKESLIGKYYLPVDNSYSVNLTSAVDYPYKNEHLYLAGTYNTEAKLCIIVSEPFTINIDGMRMVEMILVEYEKQISTIMYFKDCVRDNKTMSNGIPVIWDDEG